MEANLYDHNEVIEESRPGTVEGRPKDSNEIIQITDRSRHLATEGEQSHQHNSLIPPEEKKSTSRRGTPLQR